MKNKELIIYKTKLGREPFIEWFDSLDVKIQAKITSRLDRVESGHYGDYKTLKDGVSELRFITHKGYRIYFAEEGLKIVILLSAGDKSRQSKDIEKAKDYLNDYKERQGNNEL